MTRARKSNPDATTSLNKLQQAETRLLDMERKSLAKAANMAERLNQASSGYVEFCSGNLSACLASTDHATRALNGMSNTLLQACNRAMHDSAVLSKDAVHCHNFNDLMTLQNRLLEAASDNYFSTANALSVLLADSLTHIVAPLSKRAADIPTP